MTFDEDKSETNIEESKTAICRDFMRNVCSRGRRCKFKHPSSEELNEVVDCSNSCVVYEFCHDYQNVQCQRSNCRFIHGTHDEEEAYHNKKVLPLRLKYQYEFGVNETQENGGKNIADAGGRPVCYDFFSRESCYRGKKCKFFHPDPQKLASLRTNHESVGYNEFSKRPRMQADDEESNVQEAQKESAISGDDNSRSQKNLDEENKYLMRRVQDLEKQVFHLKATNEVLLDQNAKFRFMKKGIATVSPPTTYTTAVAISPMATVVSNAQPQRSLHFPTNVPIPAQSAQNGGPPGRQGLPRTVMAATLQARAPAPRSVPHSGAIAAQVINIAGNSGGTVETMQGTNQMVSAHGVPNQATLMQAQRPPNMTQMPVQMTPQAVPQMTQQPVPQISQHQQPVPQISQHQQQNFSTAMPNQAMGQQLVSLSLPTHRTVMGPGMPNGQCTIQTPSMGGHQSNGMVGTMGMPMPITQQTLVYTATRTTDNGQPIVNTLVSAPGHEMTLVAEQQAPQGSQVVSSMPTSMHPVQAVQHYNNVSMASPAIVQASSHQNSAYSAPMTSCIATSYAATSYSPSAASRGVRPVV